MTTAKWYFDFISPFSYLQFARISQLPNHLKVIPVPILFSALLKNWGQLGPAEIPPKRRFAYRFFQWNADNLGIPFTMPPRHPYNPLPSLRLCVAAGASIDNVRAVFEIIYGKGCQPDAADGIKEIAKTLGISDPDNTISDAAVKATLRANTQTAIAHGVFGVPTFVVRGEVFWGGDATDMMLDYLKNPALFETSEMQRVSNMPMGLIRDK